MNVTQMRLYHIKSHLVSEIGDRVLHTTPYVAEAVVVEFALKVVDENSLGSYLTKLLFPRGGLTIKYQLSGKRVIFVQSRRCVIEKVSKQKLLHPLSGARRTANAIAHKIKHIDQGKIGSKSNFDNRNKKNPVLRFKIRQSVYNECTILPNSSDNSCNRIGQDSIYSK